MYSRMDYNFLVLRIGLKPLSFTVHIWIRFCALMQSIPAFDIPTFDEPDLFLLVFVRPPTSNLG